MSEILSKKALVEAVAEKSEMAKKGTTVVVETVFDEIARTLSEDGEVDIFGFGKSEISGRLTHMGVDPATKGPLEIAASKAPEFKAAKALREAVK